MRSFVVSPKYGELVTFNTSTDLWRSLEELLDAGGNSENALRLAVYRNHMLEAPEYVFIYLLVCEQARSGLIIVWVSRVSTCGGPSAPYYQPAPAVFCRRWVRVRRHVFCEPARDLRPEQFSPLICQCCRKFILEVSRVQCSPFSILFDIDLHFPASSSFVPTDAGIRRRSWFFAAGTKRSSDRPQYCGQLFKGQIGLFLA